MRILLGKKASDAPAGWRQQIEAGERPVVLDLGAGDGRYVYECARGDAGSMYVAVDPDPETLADYAYRASRKPARGGVDNVAFVVAAVEALPPDLEGLATRVRVNFPWGSLLRGLLEPQTQVIHAIAALVRPGAEIEIVMSYHPQHDTNAFAGSPLPPLDDRYLRETLLPALKSMRVEVMDYRRMTQDEALAIPSTWGRRLLHARPRDVYFITLVPAQAR